MKIQIVSDLHLEFQSNRDWLRDNPIILKGDVLLIAGDTICDKYKKKAAFFYKTISKGFPMIISTMGNHEFYGGYIDYAFPQYENWLNEKHLHMNNGTYIYKGIKFIVSTLWSFVPFYREDEVEQSLNDYYYIYYTKNDGDKGIVRVQNTNQYHEYSVAFIKKELTKPFSGKVVLLTHHLPSYQCIAEEYRGSALNAAYASNLHEIIEDNPQIALWVCGHSHDSNITQMSNTLIVRNPLGYVDHNEQIDFIRDFIIDI